nr:hypothetical protein [Candidatus Dadabacteria bacterium]
MSKETVEHNINVPVEEEKGSTKKLQFSFLNGTFEDEDTGLKGDFTVGGHLIINLE